MAKALKSLRADHKVDLKKISRFGESEAHGAKRAHPMEDYLDELTRHLA